MKILMFLLFVSSIISFAQWKKEYSPEVEEFMKIVEEKYQTLNSVEDELILSDAELEDAMRKMYFAIAEDPEGYQNYLVVKQSEWEKNVEANSVTSSKPKFGTVIGKFQKFFENKYSYIFGRCIRIPYFLRIKIVDIAKKRYSLKGGGNRIQTEIIGKIEDVIKGSVRFKENEFVSFMYRNHLTDNLKVNEFIVGSSYFIPLSIASGVTFKGTNFDGFVVQFLDQNISYKIYDEKIETPEVLFGSSELIDWSDFEELFNRFYGG